MPNEPEFVTDHWWWRKGWNIGKRFYTWHFTFGEQDSLKGMVAQYQAAISRFPHYDLVPFEWLHLTTQGIGFVDSHTTDQVKEIVRKAEDKLKDQKPFAVTFSLPQLFSEAIACPIFPAEPLNKVRVAVRESIAEVLGYVDDPESFHPHVSFAYSNAIASAQPITEVLNSVDASPVSVAIGNVDLIRLGRDRHIYEWELVNRINFTV